MLEKDAGILHTIPEGSTGRSSGLAWHRALQGHRAPACFAPWLGANVVVPENKDVPVTLLARIHCTEGNLDLQTPSAWVLRAPHSSPHA